MKSVDFQVFVLVRAWNNYAYLEECLASIFSQKGLKKFTILLIDDCSDYTKLQQKKLTRSLFNHKYIRNRFKKYGIRNAYEVIHQFVPNNAIVINVDGDDWLSTPHSLQLILNQYHDPNCWLSYGHPNLISMTNQLRFFSSQKISPRRYSQQSEELNSYRREFFLPSHPRSWRSSLFKKIKIKDLKRPNGDWLRFCEDQAFFFPMLEMAHGKYSVLNQDVYNYRVEYAESDYTLNLKEKFFDELCIRLKDIYATINQL